MIMTNKKILFFLSFVFFFACASAQDIVKWGVKFGYDIPTNTKDFNASLAYDRTINYNVGLQLRVGERWFGQTGIEYHINKCSLLWQDTSRQNIELGYMAIPLQAGFHIIQTEKVSFRAMLGLQYRALLRLTKNDIGVEKKHFQVHNLDFMGGLGLDVYAFTLDVGYRKTTHSIMPDSKHYRDMFVLSVGLMF